MRGFGGLVKEPSDTVPLTCTSSRCRRTGNLTTVVVIPGRAPKWQRPACPFRRGPRAEEPPLAEERVDRGLRCPRAAEHEHSSTRDLTHEREGTTYEASAQPPAANHVLSERSHSFDAVELDGVVAVLREAAGPEAVSVVVASHGMGPFAGGPQLLPEVLVRLGVGSGKGRAAEVRSRLPLGIRRTARRLVPGPLRSRLQQAAGSLPAPLMSPLTKAVALPADINGYLRLNVRGREPHGSIEPGAETEAELENLRSALLELRDPASGERIVSGIVSADEAFGADRHPDVPDLMVSFRTDLGPLDACVSDRVGLVKVPVRIAHRNGDHTGEARLWLAGPGIAKDERLVQAHALDVAPTVLALLGVQTPDGLDGRALVVAP